VKLATPLYEGDSIIRPGPTAWADSVGEVHDTADFVQRDSASVDLAKIEARARVLRAAAVADYLARAWDWLGGQLDRARRRREEEYLARAQSLAELEDRLRKLERQGQLLHV
jgi:hypothetical protein